LKETLQSLGEKNSGKRVYRRKTAGRGLSIIYGVYLGKSLAFNLEFIKENCLMLAAKEILGKNIEAYKSWLGRLTKARRIRDEQLKKRS
jgi:hypothetical protein